MWEAPGRDRGTPDTASGDALGGPPDPSRPANPWPRLLAFAAVVVGMFVLAGSCFVSYARPPERELREPIASFIFGVPKFIPVTTFGADVDGHTYGAWITTTPDGEATAVLSRDAETLCHVRWDSTAPNGTSQRGAIVDPCGPGRYATDGTVLDGSAAHDLHMFTAVVEDQRVVVVRVARLTLGLCRTPDATGCSPAGQHEVQKLPSTGLPGDTGRR